MSRTPDQPDERDDDRAEHTDRAVFALLSDEPEDIPRDVEALADDAFAHGLLATALRDDHDAGARRLDRTLAALHAETGSRTRPLLERGSRARTTPGPASHATRRRRFAALPAALAIIAIACLVIFGPDLAPERVATASELVRATVDASSSLGDRRYEIRVEHDDSGRFDVIGTLDLRGDDRALMRVRTPRGDDVVVGRVGDRWWSIAPDGSAVEHDASMRWPRWIESDDSILLLEPIDAMLTRLRGSHEISFDEDTSDLDVDTATRRIVAKRRARRGPEPHRVTVVVDSESLLVHRLMLEWNRPTGRPPTDRPFDRRRGAHADQPGPDGAPRGRGARGRSRTPDGELQRGDEDGVPRRGRGAPDGARRTPPPPPNARGGAGRGGPPHHPPFRPRWFGPPRDPHLRLAPPDFGDPNQPPPPRRVRLVLEEGATFDATWFDPATHAR